MKVAFYEAIEDGLISFCVYSVTMEDWCYKQNATHMVCSIMQIHMSTRRSFITK